MIYDRLENLNDYASIDPEAFALVEEFLASCAEKTPELGRHELDGKRVYVGVQSYNTHLDGEGVKLETHCNY
ncbi:MAG: YhcH/YjgK/YiaL family protein, partial [Lentisphaeria bacterium]|nr:YhcH/YjgK/YiaL family protein [Lentisphaeria bacterium]